LFGETIAFSVAEVPVMLLAAVVLAAGPPAAQAMAEPAMEMTVAASAPRMTTLAHVRRRAD
jgi:hypothetical protein